MRKWIAALMAGTALLPAGAYAQESAAIADDQNAGATQQVSDASDPNSGDILVTAQRFQQRLQDVPISMSVIGAQELEARRVTDLKDLQYAIPGLSIYEVGTGRSTVQLRGVSTTIGASTVGTYFDETPLSLDSGGDNFSVRLIDLERVEVLRGPQATLYGQGSMGGTIRYIPAAPDLDATGGSFDGEISFTDHGDMNYRAVGVLNLPLATDVAGLRLVAGYERAGGYIDNLATGEDDINGADLYNLRASLLVRPSDRLSFTLLANYQETDQANQDIGIDYQTSLAIPSPTRDRYTLLQGKADYDLDFAVLSGSISYIDRHNFTQFDLSAFFVPTLVLVFGFPPGFIDGVGIQATTNINIFNSELRLVSQGDGPFRWQVGAVYGDLDTNQFGGTFTQPGSLPFDLVASNDQRESRTYTIYGEASYSFTPQLTATVGLRYFNEHKTRNVVATNFGLTSTDVGEATFDTLNPRFNLVYEFNRNSMIFANVAKGFRSGGFNATSAGGGVFPVPPTYDPDSIWSYELGTKHQLLDNRLVLDASVYYNDWSDVQSNNFAPGSPLIIINNSGHVSGWGVDLGVTARPIEDLILNATFGWNNLAFDEATADKAEGDPVDAAIRESWSASVDYRPPLTDDINGIFRIDYQHGGDGQFTLRNLVAGVIVNRPGRDLVNLRIGADFGPVEVSLFANNLFDENAPIVEGPFSLIIEDVEQRPRVIGISTSARF